MLILEVPALELEASRIFLNIMKYMGDVHGHKSDKLSTIKYIHTILETILSKKALCDELFVQLIRQTTQHPKLYTTALTA